MLLLPLATTSNHRASSLTRWIGCYLDRTSLLWPCLRFAWRLTAALLFSATSPGIPRVPALPPHRLSATSCSAHGCRPLRSRQRRPCPSPAAAWAASPAASFLRPSRQPHKPTARTDCAACRVGVPWPAPPHLPAGSPLRAGFGSPALPRLATPSCCSASVRPASQPGRRRLLVPHAPGKASPPRFRVPASGLAPRCPLPPRVTAAPLLRPSTRSPAPAPGLPGARRPRRLRSPSARPAARVAALLSFDLPARLPPRARPAVCTRPPRRPAPRPACPSRPARLPGPPLLRAGSAIARARTRTAPSRRPAGRPCRLPAPAGSPLPASPAVGCRLPADGLLRFRLYLIPVPCRLCTRPGPASPPCRFAVASRTPAPVLGLLRPHLDSDSRAWPASGCPAPPRIAVSGSTPTCRLRLRPGRVRPRTGSARPLPAPSRVALQAGRAAGCASARPPRPSAPSRPHAGPGSPTPRLVACRRPSSTRLRPSRLLHADRKRAACPMVHWRREKKERGPAPRVESKKTQKKEKSRIDWPCKKEREIGCEPAARFHKSDYPAGWKRNVRPPGTKRRQSSRREIRPDCSAVGPNLGGYTQRVR
ncbi:uncharacterized protein DKFZp434B061 [Triticum aestivum]|uniref:uncharacterized protein DKFZp434B061 n=1 Tax=Triticum aestivum TaxID=4565 RepID=UPI001D015027|nr:uncharacterized protein DKFZp434B061-like [Triticum aestivum]